MARKKLFYKIGEACKVLDIQPYVLRYWETEFSVLNPGKSKSGQRVYTEKDLAITRRIKTLLYEEGYTIAGAKKRLESELEANDGEIKVEKGEGTAPVAKNASHRSAGGADRSPDADEARAELRAMKDAVVQTLSEAREILALLKKSTE